jgi:hypothetical protein
VLVGGTFVAVPVDDPSLPSYTGTFTVWGGFNANGKTVNGTLTMTVHGTGSIWVYEAGSATNGSCHRSGLSNAGVHAGADGCWVSFWATRRRPR